MSRVFVSDVHLDASAPDASEQFFAFLDTHAASAEALYILGDLFEVWVGDDDPEPEKRRVVEGLRKLTDRGVACFVIHGHTHRPGVHDTVVDGEAAQRIVLGAWYEEGSYLVYENGKYDLRTLPR